jgi:hypothetical protein
VILDRKIAADHGKSVGSRLIGGLIRSLRRTHIRAGHFSPASDAIGAQSHLEVIGRHLQQLEDPASPGRRSSSASRRDPTCGSC